MKFVLFICCLFSVCHLNAQTKNQNKIIKSLLSKYESKHSISYDVDYMIKFFDEDEPNYVKSKVEIVKSKKDTIFSESFLYNRNDTIINCLKFYRPENLYLIDFNEKLITKYDATKGEIFPIRGNIDGEVLSAGFKEIKKMVRVTKNPNNKVSYQDSLHFLNILIKYPDDGDDHGMKKKYVIDTEKLLLTQIDFEAQYKDQIQKNKWILNNITFNQVTELDLEKKVEKYFKMFRSENYIPLTDEDYELIENGIEAPKLNGSYFPNYIKQSTLEIDKITILDFWYTSCMPCIKVIPHLNQLKAKYQDKIEIIGVNPIESKIKDQERIERFLKRTPMDYPIFLVQDLPKEFNVRAYPTLYILDNNNNVIFSKIGSSDETFNEIDQFLMEYLK